MTSYKKTILMTGGTGYLGSRIAERLCGNYRVILAKHSLSSLKRIENIASQVELWNRNEADFPENIEKNAIDIFLHCATNYGRESEDLLEIANSNLMLPLLLLRLAENNSRNGLYAGARFKGLCQQRQ